MGDFCLKKHQKSCIFTCFRCFLVEILLIFYAFFIKLYAIAITTDAINPLNRLEIRYCGIKYDAAYNKPILITRLKNPNVSIFIGIAIMFIIGLTNKFNTVITAANNIAYQKLSIEIPGI